MNRCVRGNPDLCMGCRTCLIACVVAHSEKPIFEIDPDGFTFNPKLHMVKTAKITVPIQCKHCESPACLAACPEKIISIVDGTVVIDTKHCIGCKCCMDACPFGAIDMVEVYGEKQKDGRARIVANKCDLCRGVEGGPQCVRVCPTEALKLVEEYDVDELVSQRRLKTVENSRDLANTSREASERPLPYSDRYL